MRARNGGKALQRRCRHLLLVRECPIFAATTTLPLAANVARELRNLAHPLEMCQRFFAYTGTGGGLRVGKPRWCQ